MVCRRITLDFRCGKQHGHGTLSRFCWWQTPRRAIECWLSNAKFICRSRNCLSQCLDLSFSRLVWWRRITRQWWKYSNMVILFLFYGCHFIGWNHSMVCAQNAWNPTYNTRVGCHWATQCIALFEKAKGSIYRNNWCHKKHAKFYVEIIGSIPLSMVCSFYLLAIYLANVWGKYGFW